MRIRARGLDRFAGVESGAQSSVPALHAGKLALAEVGSRGQHRQVLQRPDDRVQTSGVLGIDGGHARPASGGHHDRGHAEINRDACG